MKWIRYLNIWSHFQVYEGPEHEGQAGRGLHGHGGHVHDLPGEGRHLQRGQQEDQEARGDPNSLLREDLHPLLPDR